MNIHRFLTTLFAALLALPAVAQIKISAGGNGFPLVTGGKATPLYVAPNDELTVKRVARLFADDIRRVADVELTPAETDDVRGRYVLVAATLGHNKFVEHLVKRHRIDVSAIKGGWEQYVIQIVPHPQKGIEAALVVVGSDKRGTAYGLLSVSEAMGVSPFYWWADVPVRRSREVWITGGVTSKPPTVKYRGIFINDEDRGFYPWAARNFEKELGGVGPKTYAKVCELILRLKGNMLAPAMHPCTGAFYFYPDNKLVADSFGLFITTSHCEPLLLNNAAKTEWDTQRDGDWNYATNSKTILNKWNKRLDEAARFDNIYTMAMRGIHDRGLRGNLSLDDRTQLLEKVIDDQRQLLTTHTKKPITKIPQIFVPYKETMEVYANGLRVPDDITLVWVDDNYGYMKHVSNPEEQKRSGGSGVYYHISYCGPPHDYLWLCTTPPVLMYEELMKAYNTGANRYWLLNVGDIKPGELAIKTFFDLAWDCTAFDFAAVNNNQSQFLANLYGQAYGARFRHMLNAYYRLAWSRKPEFMAWDQNYGSYEQSLVRDAEYSFTHYGEAQQRLDDYETLANEASAIMWELPENWRPSFFELVAYPIMASAQVNRKFLLSKLNHRLHTAGHPAQANWAARQATQAYDSLVALTNTYNSLLGGKWKGMMNLQSGWNTTYMPHPNLAFEGIQSKRFDLATTPQLRVDSMAGEEPVDLSANWRDALAGCFVVNLAAPLRKVTKSHTFSLIEGLGYDGHVLQMGRPTEAVADASRRDGDRVEFALPTIDKDSVEVTLFTVPFFPLYQGVGTRIGVSVDGGRPQVFDNRPSEFGELWKTQVLRNGAVARLKFAVDVGKSSHTLALICGDPGQMVQKVIIDWGGLQPSYLGPTQ